MFHAAIPWAYIGQGVSPGKTVMQDTYSDTGGWRGTGVTLGAAPQIGQGSGVTGRLPGCAR